MKVIIFVEFLFFFCGMVLIDDGCVYICGVERNGSFGLIMGDNRCNVIVKFLMDGILVFELNIFLYDVYRIMMIVDKNICFLDYENSNKW